MPSVLWKPRSLVSEAVNDIIEPRPTLSVDLSELIDNAVANLKLPRRKPKRKIKNPCSICEKRVYDLSNLSSPTIVIFESTKNKMWGSFRWWISEVSWGGWWIPWSCTICQI